MAKVDINEIKRLNLLRMMKERNISQAELAQKMNVTAARISSLLGSGRKVSRNIGQRTLEKLCEIFDVKETEFIRFDVIGLEKDDLPRAPVPIVDKRQIDPRKPAKKKAGSKGPILGEDKTPYLGTTEGAEMVHPARRTSPQAFAIRVEDDSMWPRFMQGDIIVIDPEEPYENGDRCLVWVNGELLFRIYTKAEKEIRLTALNSKYPEIAIPLTSQVEYYVIGKVVWMEPNLS
jgi:SOS-response transcriptional repressor LexA